MMQWNLYKSRGKKSVLLKEKKKKTTIRKIQLEMLKQNKEEITTIIK